MKIKCIVIDDEPLAREGIADYIAQIPFLMLIGTYRNVLEANQIFQQESVDLIYLDIEMPEITGIDFLKSRNSHSQVILTTAYREYAIEGFNLDVIDYLVKPYDFHRFLRATNKAYDRIRAIQPNPYKEDSFFIKEDHKLIRIRFTEVLFIQSYKDYVFLFTEQSKHIVLISLKNVEQSLPSEQFVRVHRSYIVALDKIQEIDGNILKVKDHNIPVGKHIRDQLLNKIVGQNLWRR